jgi:hydroxyacid-oxoacid transhydrogenase
MSVGVVAFRSLNNFMRISPLPVKVAFCFSSLSNSYAVSPCDTIFELAASNIRYGQGATAEVGMDLKDMGAKRVLVVTDKNIEKLAPMKVLLQSMDQNGIADIVVYSNVRVEPSDISIQAAIQFMKQQQDHISAPFDAIVALGGGSVIDTAKAVNLYHCYPPKDFYDYVNVPVGLGMPVPGPLLPLYAIPTTAGTGSETTGMIIFDDTRSRCKTGIGHRRLKPTLGILDPDNTATLPPEVAKYSGLDVLCHAIESYTALPFNKRPAPKNSASRPSYQGSNPISDVWSLHALKTCVDYLQRAVNDPEGDIEARSNMLLASTSAGIGFGNAGVHLCHGMSYPIASQVKTYKPPSGYITSKDDDHPLIPHGHSVIVSAPAVFRFTGQACPERHLDCANILASKRDSGRKSRISHQQHILGEYAGSILADEILEFMHQLSVPVGIRAVGYNEEDVPELVKGTLQQERVTKISPMPVSAAELEALFLDSLDE